MKKHKASDVFDEEEKAFVQMVLKETKGKIVRIEDIKKGEQDETNIPHRR